MSTYTQILYQIVYSTKHRGLTIHDDNRDKLFGYLAGILQKKNCYPYQIGGVEDHLHIVTHIHPSVARADLVKDMKLASTDLIKSQKWFSEFNGWQDGYGAFTYSISAKQNLINYVKNQVAHHRKIEFIDEYKGLLEEHHVEFDKKYLL